MVNVEKIQGLLRNLEASLAQLSQISQIEREEFLHNNLALGAAKYYLQTAIEACFDIGNYIISSEGFRPPRDYRDVFSILQENQVIDEELAIKMRQMAGLRNHLVHLYWEIDDELIYGYVHSNLSDFEAYIQRIVKFIH